MRFIAIIIFASADRLVALTIAKPIPNLNTGGTAIPLVRLSPLDSNKSIDLDAISSHGISVREKILSGLDNYEVNTGKKHPFTVKQRELGLGTRGASVPLKTYQSNIWMAEISIGTPPKTLKAQIDTGAADMWVLETGCSGISGNRDLWDPYLSESADYQDQSFRLDYKDGTIVEGDKYIDNVTIAGFTADPQIFRSVESYTSTRLENNGYADGLLGLAYPSVSRLNAFPLFASLIRQGKIINPTFSLKLSPSGAEIYVGGANSMLYSGDIAYTPVVYPALWQVSMDDVRANGYRILIRNGFQNSTNGLAVPASDVQVLISITYRATLSQQLQPIEEGSPNCYSAIVAEQAPVGYWAIGITFFQGVYSVFDYNNAQVGFATLA